MLDGYINSSFWSNRVQQKSCSGQWCFSPCLFPQGPKANLGRPAKKCSILPKDDRELMGFQPSSPVTFLEFLRYPIRYPSRNSDSNEHNELPINELCSLYNPLCELLTSLAPWAHTDGASEIVAACPWGVLSSCPESEPPRPTAATVKMVWRTFLSQARFHSTTSTTQLTQQDLQHRNSSPLKFHCWTSSICFQSRWGQPLPAPKAHSSPRDQVRRKKENIFRC